MAAGAIPSLPVYVDSPMALATLDVYRHAIADGWDESGPIWSTAAPPPSSTCPIWWRCAPWRSRSGSGGCRSRRSSSRRRAWPPVGGCCTTWPSGRRTTVTPSCCPGSRPKAREADRWPTGPSGQDARPLRAGARHRGGPADVLGPCRRRRAAGVDGAGTHAADDGVRRPRGNRRRRPRCAVASRASSAGRRWRRRTSSGSASIDPPRRRRRRGGSVRARRGGCSHCRRRWHRRPGSAPSGGARRSWA